MDKLGLDKIKILDKLGFGWKYILDENSFLNEILLINKIWLFFKINK